MAEGEWVPKEVKEQVYSILNEADRQGKQLVSKEVHAALLPWLKDNGYRPYALRTVQRVIKDLHDHATIEIPWSVGISAREGIPDEAIGTIIKIWQWSFTVGHRFTVREARWIARLRNAFPRANDEDLRYLHYVAASYAARERAKETLQYTDFESEGLDYFIFYEIGLSKAIGMTPEKMSELNTFTKEHMDTAGGNLDLIPTEKIVMPPKYLLIADPVKAIELRLGLMVKHAKGMSNKQRLEYCYILRLAESLPEWEKKTLEEKNAEAQSYYDEIVGERGVA